MSYTNYKRSQTFGTFVATALNQTTRALGSSAQAPLGVGASALPAELTLPSLRAALNAPRPHPKGGNQPRNVHKLRQVLADELQDLTSASSDTFSRYVRNMCSVLHLLGYRAEELQRNSRFTKNLAQQLRQDHAALKKIGLSSTVISERVHLWTIPDLRQLVKRANQHFRKGKGRRRSCSAAVIDTVLRGVYPSFDALLEAHQRISKEAHSLFDTSAQTARVKGSAIGLALRRPRLDIEQCHKRYTKAQANGVQLAKTKGEVRKLARTFAGWVMDGRFASVKAAHTAHRRTRKKVTKLFVGENACDTIIGTTTLLILKGLYPDAESALKGLKAIREEVAAAAEQDPRLKAVQRFLVGLIYSRAYKTSEEAITKYKRALDRAEALFQKNRFANTLARTAAMLVMRRRFKDSDDAFIRYRKLSTEAETTIATNKPGSRVRLSLILMAFKGDYANVKSAYRDFLKTRPTVQEKCKDRVLRGRSIEALVIKHMQASKRARAA